MARIRTIKPEFWTDEKIVQLPYPTRLLFIGMWNFADDHGLLEDEPERIKMQVMPADDIDPIIHVDLLLAVGLVERHFTSENKTYLSIPHFKDHQKVDHPAKSKIFREGSRKVAIPSAVRREVAKKYGCEPGESTTAECYYCGTHGEIMWWRTTKGKPSSWVSFDHEIDHLVCENDGGTTTSDNLVLACRSCNRSKGTRDFVTFALKPRESSRGLAPEWKGEEGKGEELKESKLGAKFEEKRAWLSERFPDVDLEFQKEKLLTKYDGSKVMDPWQLILAWFEALPKKPPARQSKSADDDVWKGVTI